ncbi:MAG: hypothetical protein RRY65_06035, partial [Pseudoflavonifractor sp.]
PVLGDPSFASKAPPHEGANKTHCNIPKANLIINIILCNFVLDFLDIAVVYYGSQESRNELR